MARYTSSVSPKGQVTLPAAVREQFGIKPKDKVVFEIVDGTLTIQPVLAQLRAFYRAVPALDPPRDWKEVERIAHEDAAERALGRRDEPPVRAG